MKQYFAIWGAWEVTPNSYQNETGYISAFEISASNGYEPVDIDAIHSLEVGQFWHSAYGNHIIIRIPENAKFHQVMKEAV